MNKEEVIQREMALMARAKEVNHEMATLTRWSYKCIECGKRTKATYGHEIRMEMIGKELCFDCLFWMKHVEFKDAPVSVRVNGEHYRIADEFTKDGRGHGGSKFTILFNDGRKVVTTNLWSQGEIPKRFRDRLVDNATFG